MNRYDSDDELKHYGVIGMKWGSRKGRTWSSGTTRKLARKLERMNARGQTGARVNAVRASYNKNRKLDAEMSRRAKKMSVGKAMVTDLLKGGTTEANMRYDATRKYYGKGTNAMDVASAGVNKVRAKQRRARNVALLAGATLAGAAILKKRKRVAKIAKLLPAPLPALPLGN